jgi:diguanylate cyclase (GGDEF)-like protein
VSARSVIASYWAGMAGLTTVVLVVPASTHPGWSHPGWSLAAWTAVGALAAIAILVGVARYRPARVWPWALMSLAIAVSTAADAIYTKLPSTPGLGTANLLYLASFVGGAVALLRFARSGSRGLEQTGLLDALAVTLVLLLLIWVVVLRPVGPDLWTLATPSLIAYPIGDALLLATTVRLLTARRQTRSVLLLVGGALAVLVADSVNGLASGAASAGGVGAGGVGGNGVGGTVGSGTVGLVANVGLLFFYACWGAAALHPSMIRLTAPEVLGERELTLRRLWVVAGIALVPPAILLVEAAGGEVRDGVVLSLATGVLFLLSLARIAATANSHRRSLVFRERHDTLTGLANRAHLVERVGAAVTSYASGAQRDGQVAVMLVDLDDFRLVNDTSGHSVGDEVLVAVARRLVRQLSRHDLVARFGGDEFAILIGPNPGGRDVPELLNQLAMAMSEPVLVAGRSINLTACIGLSTVDSLTAPDLAGADPTRVGHDLLRQAGLALQAAKESGPGQSCRYESEKHGRMVERMRLREALARAVTEGAFALQYQPIVLLDSSATVGFEALVRWEHPTRGLVAPSEFIALAEETGLIEPIGDLVLRTAVAAAVRWSVTTTDEAYVSVNVSARQFRTPGFAERVDRVLTAAGLRPSLLMLEITESVLMREDDHVWGELATLRNTGVRLAIDDFGTGFSSLSYLEQTPIDVIKIDKSFVNTLVTSDRQRTVVEGIVLMAEKLGLQVVAEGIETEAERDLLAEMRCPYGQGYLYAVPLTDAEATSYLAFPPAPPPSPRRTAPGTIAGTIAGTTAGTTLSPAEPQIPAPRREPAPTTIVPISLPADAAAEESTPAVVATPSVLAPPGTMPP